MNGSILSLMREAYAKSLRLRLKIQTVKLPGIQLNGFF